MGCNYVSMLGLKLTRVSKQHPRRLLFTHSPSSPSPVYEQDMKLIIAISADDPEEN